MNAFFSDYVCGKRVLFLLSSILSVKRIQSKWSISCCTITDLSHWSIITFSLYFSSRYFTLIERYLGTFHLSSGILRHHSSKSIFSSECSTISGLIIIIVWKLSSSRSFSRLTTISLLLYQTCGAASQTHPFSGSLICLIISFQSFAYFFIFSLGISLLIFLRILLSCHFSIANIEWF